MYDGQAGYLDHALASYDLKMQLASIQQWQINADEPSALDYNDYNPADNYSSDHFGSTDHDPLLVSFNLGQAPTVSSTSPEDGSTTNQEISSITIGFSKEVLADGSANAANNPGNYLLLESMGDGFQTKSCASGQDPSDTPVTINSTDYHPATFSATLEINNGNPLPGGDYRIYVCDTTSIEDLKGRELNNGTANFVSTFTADDPGNPSNRSTTSDEQHTEPQTNNNDIQEHFAETKPFDKTSLLLKTKRFLSGIIIESIRIYLL